MIAVSNLPKTQINLLFRGGYKPGSRGRNIKKGDNWKLKCINCNKTFPNRVILRKHYHTDCKFFDTESDMKTEVDNTDTKNKENELKIESIKKTFNSDSTENKPYLETRQNNPEANITFRERTSLAKCQGGSEEEAALVNVNNDKKLHTDDNDQTRNINDNLHQSKPKSEEFQENIKSGLKRKQAYMFPALMFANEQISKTRRLHEAPKNLYQSLSEDILQEKWHSRFDRVPNDSRQFNCPECNISFKYKNKLEMHLKYVHGEFDTTNNGVETNVTKDAVKEEPIMPQSVDKEELSPEITPSNSTDKRAVHACTLCQTKYRHMSRLRRHMKQVHGYIQDDFDRKFKCSECDSAYSNKSSLMRHIKDSHDADVSKSVKIDVKKEQTTESAQDQQCNTQVNIAQNITAVNVMQYLRAYQICLNQTMSPGIQAIQNNVSREQHICRSDNIKTPSQKQQFSCNRAKCDKPNISDTSGSVRNVERSSPTHTVDDNDIPLDLSMKTGSECATGSKAKSTSNEAHSSHTINPIPQACLDEEKRIIHSYYKDFLAEYGFCRK